MFLGCHFFQICFEDSDDIYIVRVDSLNWPDAVKEAKKKIIGQLHGVKDFKIKEVTLSSLLNSFHFKNGIAQIKNITHL